MIEGTRGDRHSVLTFSINGKKIFSHNLFTGVLFSVYPSYKLIRGCIPLHFWVNSIYNTGGDVCI